jgi:hypothetical protein
LSTLQHTSFIIIDTRCSDICAPDICALDFCAPDFCAPDICAPDFCAPDFCAHDLSAPVKKPTFPHPIFPSAQFAHIFKNETSFSVKLRFLSFIQPKAKTHYNPYPGVSEVAEHEYDTYFALQSIFNYWTLPQAIFEFWFLIFLNFLNYLFRILIIFLLTITTFWWPPWY